MAPRNAFQKNQNPPPPNDEPRGWNAPFSNGETPAAGWAKPPLLKVEKLEETAPPAAADTGTGRSHIEGIPTANWHEKARKPDTRQRTKARYLSLLPANKKALTKHANQLNVRTYELIRYLLEYGLGQVKAGDLQFEPRLAPNGLTLYPHEKKRRKTRSSNPDLQNTSCRGIPDKTWDELKNLAANYPLWQVINKLLEHGIAQIEAGELVIQPQASDIKTLY